MGGCLKLQNVERTFSVNAIVVFVEKVGLCIFEKSQELFCVYVFVDLGAAEWGESNFVLVFLGECYGFFAWECYGVYSCFHR